MGDNNTSGPSGPSASSQDSEQHRLEFTSRLNRNSETGVAVATTTTRPVVVNNQVPLRGTLQNLQSPLMQPQPYPYYPHAVPFFGTFTMPTAGLPFNPGQVSPPSLHPLAGSSSNLAGAVHTDDNNRQQIANHFPVGLSTATTTANAAYPNFWPVIFQQSSAAQSAPRCATTTIEAATQTSQEYLPGKSSSSQVIDNKAADDDDDVGDRDCEPETMPTTSLTLVAGGQASASKRFCALQTMADTSLNLTDQQRQQSINDHQTQALAIINSETRMPEKIKFGSKLYICCWKAADCNRSDSEYYVREDCRTRLWFVRRIDEHSEEDKILQQLVSPEKMFPFIQLQGCTVDSNYGLARFLLFSPLPMTLEMYAKKQQPLQQLSLHQMRPIAFQLITAFKVLEEKKIQYLQPISLDDIHIADEKGKLCIKLSGFDKAKLFSDDANVHSDWPALGLLLLHLTCGSSAAAEASAALASSANNAGEDLQFSIFVHFQSNHYQYTQRSQMPEAEKIALIVDCNTFCSLLDLLLMIDGDKSAESGEQFK